MDTIMKPKYIFNYLIIAIFKVHLHHNCSCFHSPGSSWKEGCGKLTGGQGLVPLGRLLLLPRPRPGPRKRPLILCPTGNDKHCWVSHGDTDGDGEAGAATPQATCSLATPRASGRNANRASCHPGRALWPQGWGGAASARAQRGDQRGLRRRGAASEPWEDGGDRRKASGARLGPQGCPAPE